MNEKGTLSVCSRTDYFSYVTQSINFSPFMLIKSFILLVTSVYWFSMQKAAMKMSASQTANPLCRNSE